MSIQKKLVRRGILASAAGLLILGPVAWVHTHTAQAAARQGSRVAPRVMEAVDEAQRVVLRGNVHPKARAEFDRGAVSDAQPITKMLLLLQRSAEQEAELRQLMEEQQSTNSANFHAWLTPEEFGRRFGPADEDVQAVTTWLAGHGFGNISVTKGRTLVQFAGTAGQVRSAFGTAIHKYNVKGEEHFANASDPQIPAALAPVVRGLVALHNFRPRAHVHNMGTVQRNAKTGEVRPTFTFNDVNGTFYGLGPGDFAKIYNVPTGTFDGSGQSIAIVGQTNINLQDVRDFRSNFGLPANDPLIILNGPDPGLVEGDETESDLDVQWAGAVAPGATIKFVTTETTETDFVFGVDASAVFIVDNNVAPILSESYGSCEAGLGAGGNAFRNTLWQQAAAEGITVVVSTGDNGAANCDPAAAPANQNAASLGAAVSGFASTPFNVAVGGTDFDDVTTQTTFFSASNNGSTQASALGYIPETTWNDSCARTAKVGSVSGICTTVSSAGADLVAGSGGPSSCALSGCAGYAKPSWQQGLTANDGVRDTPDVSFFASDGGPTGAPTKTFYVICESDQDITGDTGCSLTKFVTTQPFHDFQAVGGTSASTPAFAAIVALINQAKGGGRQGNVNYALYNTYNAVKGDPTKLCNSSSFAAPSAANTCVFYDITKGNISVACQGGTPNCSNTSAAANQVGVLTTNAGGTTPAFLTSPGYDLATGLGSVNVANLITAWAPTGLTATSITLSPIPPPVVLGQGVTVSGTVSAATATGVVVLENPSTGEVFPPTLGSNVISSGSYSFQTSLLPAGSYNVVAHYGGDRNFSSSDSSPLAVNIARLSSLVAVDFLTFGANGISIPHTSSASVSYGSPYILRIDVTELSGATCQNSSTTLVFACPSGTIQLFDGTTPLNDFPNAQTSNATNTAKLNDRGFVEDQPIQLPAGSYNLNATFTADATSSFNSTSTSNTVAVTVTKATSSAAVTSNVASVAAGGSVTLTATISTTSNGAGPTGTVQFKSGSSNLGSAATCTPSAANVNSAASCTATLSTTLSEMVPLARPGVRNWPHTPILLMLMGAAVAAFLAAQRRMPMGRRVGYAAAGLVLFACVAAGIAGCSGGGGSGGGGGGSHADSITATYGGDTNYSGSTSAALTVTVQ